MRKMENGKAVDVSKLVQRLLSADWLFHIQYILCMVYGERAHGAGSVQVKAGEQDVTCMTWKGG